MKSNNSIRLNLMTVFVLAFLILAQAHSTYAGDKIGNGGGLWACLINTNVNFAHLVDLYEAKEELGLTPIAATSTDPMVLVGERSDFLKDHLPELSTKLEPHFSTVMANIHYVNAQLTIVDDALYRISPLPQSCPNGNWEYVQFANYSHLNSVLIRKDLWESASVSALDKSALIWHEIIYRWLRTEYNDSNSVRARQIVGILYSQLSDAEMKKQIDSALSTNQPTPTPTPPPINVPEDEKWVCLSTSMDDGSVYLGYASLASVARDRSFQKCQASRNPFSCNSFDIKCDQILSQEQKFDCKITNTFSNKEYSGRGRSFVESGYHTITACLLSGEHSCTLRDVHCN